MRAVVKPEVTLDRVFLQRDLRARTIDRLFIIVQQIPFSCHFPSSFHLRACGGQVAHAPSRRRAVCAGSLVTRAPAVGKTRTGFVPLPSLARPRACGGQVAHAPSRRRAVCAGSLVTRAPAAGKSRTGFVPLPSLARPHTCGEQDAHAPSRRRAVCAGSLVTRAPAVGKTRTGFVPLPSLARPRTCGEQFAHRVYFVPVSRTHAHLRWARRAPGLCLCPASHARAPAAGNSRTGFVSSPSLARPRLFPGAGPCRAPVFPNAREACAPARRFALFVPLPGLARPRRGDYLCYHITEKGKSP